MVTTDGDSVGAVELGRPDWPDGSIVYRGSEPNLRVVGHLDAETPEDFAVLVIEEV